MKYEHYFRIYFTPLWTEFKKYVLMILHEIKIIFIISQLRLKEQFCILRPRTFLQCFALDSRCSKAKHCWKDEKNWYKTHPLIFVDYLLKTRVLYMSFDRFLLAVESCDLSQADKILIRVFFPKTEWTVAELFFLSLTSPLTRSSAYTVVFPKFKKPRKQGTPVLSLIKGHVFGKADHTT